MADDSVLGEVIGSASTRREYLHAAYLSAYPTLHLERYGRWAKVSKAVSFIPKALGVISQRKLRVRVSYHIFDREGRTLGISGGDLVYSLSDREFSLLRDSIVQIEDRRFFVHRGIDPKAIARSIFRNILALAVVQGGSTITQQLVRNTLLTPDRSLIRKLLEILLALKLERHYSKEEILRLYCQLVYLGNGVRGFSAASRSVYRMALSQIGTHDVYGLIGLLRCPSKAHPLTNLAAFESRRRIVAGVLGRSSSVRVDIRDRELNPIFVNSLKKPRWSRIINAALTQELGLIPNDVRRVAVTIVPEVQRAVDEALKETSFGVDIARAATVCIQNSTGEVLAESSWEAGKESEFSPTYFGIVQPGSTFKTFAVLAALEQGISPETKFDSRPFVSSCFLDRNQRPWTVRNYAERYRNSLSLEDALRFSDNSAFAQLAETLDLRQLFRVYEKFRLCSADDATPAIVLGGLDQGIPLISLVAAYAAIARGGNYIHPKFVRHIEYCDGSFVCFPLSPEETVVADYKILATIGTLLRLSGQQFFGYGFSGKTGTTRTGSLLAVYNDQISVAIWVDFRKPIPEEAPKARGAVSVMERIVQKLMGHQSNLLSI